MSETWVCQQCNTKLRCGCQSMECSFDLDITSHVRNHLLKAAEHALNWMDCERVRNVVELAIITNQEPCCNACVTNNG